MIVIVQLNKATRQIRDYCNLKGSMSGKALSITVGKANLHNVHDIINKQVIYESKQHVYTGDRGMYTY